MDGAAWCWVPSGLTLYPNAPMGRQIASVPLCKSPSQFPPTAASTRCQSCRGGAGSPPAALGAGPLASAASSSVRLSAGQASYFCRCNSRVGAQSSVLLPALCTAYDHIKHPTISTPTHTSSASSCFVRAGPSSSSGQVPNPRAQGLPESHGLARCCQADGEKGRADHPWRARGT